MKKVVSHAVRYITELGLKSVFTESYQVRGLVLDIAASIGVMLTDDELRKAVQEVMGE
jgi:hypothetical protein